MPWSWEHVRAAQGALRHHLGAGDALCCFGPKGDQREPCFVIDSRRDWEGYATAAGHALKALDDDVGRLTYAQMEAIILALEHAVRHPPASGERSTPVSPYPFAEAGQILDSWMADYDSRLPR